MDLNDIQLSGAQLAGLYPKTLVALAGEAPAQTAPAAAPEVAEAPAPAAPQAVAAPQPAAAPQQGPSYLGQNGKGILVVTADPSVAYLDDADLSFLTNVLGACNLGMADVAIVNWERLQAKEGSALTGQLGARQVLLFSVTPDAFGLPANFPPFQVQNLGGKTYVHAPALSAIAADKELKKALWLSLKKLFGV